MKKETLKSVGKTCLRIATDILPKLPTKGDSPLQLTIKGFAIWDSINKLFESDESPEDKFVRVNGLKRHINPYFIEMFCASRLTQLFELGTVKVDTLMLNKAHSEKYGTIYWSEYNKNAHGLFYSDGHIPIEEISQQIWTLYERGIIFDVDRDYYNRKRLISEISPFVDPIAKETETILRDFTAHHLKTIHTKRSRTYLFLGLPGTGKTTFAQKFSEKLASKTLKITSEAFLDMKLDYFEFLMSSLHPEVVIVDDIDRCIYNYKLLQIMEDIPRKYNDLTVVFTGNKLRELDPALVRPGRIDDVIEFPLPTLNERIEVLKLYADTSINEEYINKVAQLTEGMSHAWLKELAIQMNLEPEDKLLERAKRMLVITGQLKTIEEEAAKEEAASKKKKKREKRQANGKSEAHLVQQKEMGGGSKPVEPVAIRIKQN